MSWSFTKGGRIMDKLYRKVGKRYMERHVFIFYRDKVQFIQNYFR